MKTDTLNVRTVDSTAFNDQKPGTSGLRPDFDVEIKFVGLRPGEKLFEELLTEAEGLTSTKSKRIFVGKPQEIDTPRLSRRLGVVYEAATKDDEKSIRQTLDTLVGGTLLAERI